MWGGQGPSRTAEPLKKKLVRKETTSKVATTISVQVIKYSFYGDIPGT
jgi:hypothetical protein